MTPRKKWILGEDAPTEPCKARKYDMTIMAAPNATTMTYSDIIIYARCEAPSRPYRLSPSHHATHGQGHRLGEHLVSLMELVHDQVSHLPRTEGVLKAAI